MSLNFNLQFFTLYDRQKLDIERNWSVFVETFSKKWSKIFEILSKLEITISGTLGLAEGLIWFETW